MAMRLKEPECGHKLQGLWRASEGDTPRLKSLAQLSVLHRTNLKIIREMTVLYSPRLTCGS